MRDAWESLPGGSPSPSRPASWCRRTPRPASRSRSRRIEDPLFGPVVSFGISGPLTELLGDRSYRIPPLGERDAADDGPRDQVLADAVRLPRQRDGRRGRGRAADAAGRPAPERPAAGALARPALVLAGAEGATVLTAIARVEPVADPGPTGSCAGPARGTPSGWDTRMPGLRSMRRPRRRQLARTRGRTGHRRRA